MNFNDDDGGILWGNWSDDYEDGTSPTAWSGSGAILEQFWRTREVVKYAQCWVFGGTLTSGGWVWPEIKSSQCCVLVKAVIEDRLNDFSFFISFPTRTNTHSPEVLGHPCSTRD